MGKSVISNSRKWENVRNSLKFSEILWKCQKFSKILWNSLKLSQNGLKLSQNGLKLSQNGPEWVPTRPEWVPVEPVVVPVEPVVVSVVTLWWYSGGTVGIGGPGPVPRWGTTNRPYPVPPLPRVPTTRATRPHGSSPSTHCKPAVHHASLETVNSQHTGTPRVRRFPYSH